MTGLTLDALRALEFPPTEVVVGPGGFWHDLAPLLPYEVRDALPREEGDLVVLVGKQRRVEQFEEIAAHRGRVVVAFGPDDLPVAGEYLGEDGRLPASVAALYAMNVELADPRAVALPLGVRGRDMQALRLVAESHAGRRDGLLYGSFALKRVRRERGRMVGGPLRARLAEQMAGASWATMDVFFDRRDDPRQQIEYFSQIARHRFTLSPPGFGVDCYRTWESLYLGAIPVVLRSPAMSEFTDLPILFVDDYGELSEDFLERSWERMSRRSYDFRRLMRSHYVERFLDAVASLDSPRFVCLRSGRFPPGGRLAGRAVQARSLPG